MNGDTHYKKSTKDTNYKIQSTKDTKKVRLFF